VTPHLHCSFPGCVFTLLAASVTSSCNKKANKQETHTTRQARQSKTMTDMNKLIGFCLNQAGVAPHGASRTVVRHTE
jgi:hypothetical protein